MSWTTHLVLAAAFAGAHLAPPTVRAQHEPSSIVIVTGQQATMPIPTLMEDMENTVANFEMADHLFLRLAGIGPGLLTAGDRGFVPLLAKSWSRPDSLTLVFELDPRARWHDGEPVTSRDVTFTYRRALDRTIVPRLALDLLRRIAKVEAEGDHRVIFRFKEVYAEQLYDATFHVPILPAHLLEKLPPTAEAWSGFVRNPIGSGPYRWVRRVEGEFIELAANQSFFLGRPGTDRLIVRVAKSADARLNLLLSGEVDAMDNINPTPTNLSRVKADSSLRLVSAPSNSLGYLLYNRRDPENLGRPHPILSDLDVRRAIGLAIDRDLLIRATLGQYGDVPYGPVSSQLWIRHGAPEPSRQDQSAARRLLAGRGWVDRDGDGIREDRDGKPLSLRLTVSTTSSLRPQMALMIQEQLRQVGVRIELLRVDAPVWIQRRKAGNFDIDFSSGSQDPSPSGLTFSWSCNGAGNVAKYCDPAADSLLDRAILSPTGDRKLWHQFLKRVEEEAPATFLYNQAAVFAINRRFRDVVITPESYWSSVWRWSAAGS